MGRLYVSSFALIRNKLIFSVLTVKAINEVNWNILLTLGKEIKRDSASSENETRKAY